MMTLNNLLMAEMSLTRHYGHVLFFVKKERSSSIPFQKRTNSTKFQADSFFKTCSNLGTQNYQIMHSKKTHPPVKVLTHSNSWKSHNLMDMSAEHDAKITINMISISQLPHCPSNYEY